MPDPNTPSIPPPVSDAEPWDKVDQGSWESFPASDPPAFGSTRAAPSKRSINESNAEVKAQLSAGRRRRIILAAAIGGGVIAAGVATLLVVRTLRARARC